MLKFYKATKKKTRREEIGGEEVEVKREQILCVWVPKWIFPSFDILKFAKKGACKQKRNKSHDERSDERSNEDNVDDQCHQVDADRIQHGILGKHNTSQRRRRQKVVCMAEGSWCDGKSLCCSVVVQFSPFSFTRSISHRRTLWTFSPSHDDKSSFWQHINFSCNIIIFKHHFVALVRPPPAAPPSHLLLPSANTQTLYFHI